MTKLQVFLGGAAAIATLALAGCGKNKAVVASQEYADKICGCKDVECAKKESEAFGKKAEELKDLRGSDADAKEIEAAMKKALDCSMKLALKDVPKEAAPADSAAGEKKEAK
jgi:hypothetical protein